MKTVTSVNCRGLVRGSGERQNVEGMERDRIGLVRGNGERQDVEGMERDRIGLVRGNGERQDGEYCIYHNFYILFLHPPASNSC